MAKKSIVAIKVTLTPYTAEVTIQRTWRERYGRLGQSTHLYYGRSHARRARCMIEIRSTNAFIEESAYLV